jgi:diaminopropionate ammonia-lyase
MPDYSPTPLTELPELARELGVGRVFVKDESARMGLPAFKVLGVTWAVHRVLAARATVDHVSLIAATDGNHGRAVARMARLLGHGCRVFVPAGVLHPQAEAAIAAEGAEVVTVAGSYDDALVQAAGSAMDDPSCVLVQDTAWAGYEEIPGWIVEGYSTLFAEIDAQLSEAGAHPPGLVAVPVGVGSLAQAALTHYRSRPTRRAPAILSVEPEAAACVLACLDRGELVSVPTGFTTMAGLNCGTPSTLAWPFLRDGLDAAVAVADDEAARAIRDLAVLGVSAGPCGAASLAGARRVLTGNGSTERRADLALGPTATVILLSTEGATANPGAPSPDDRYAATTSPAPA